MAGLLDFLAGSSDPSTADPTTGLVESQRRQLAYGILGQTGAALLAAGAPSYPGQQGQYLAQLGNIPGNVANQQSQMVQQNAMAQREQQLQRQNQQQKELMAYTKTPDFQQAFESMPAGTKAIIKGQMLNNDMAGALKTMQEARAQTQPINLGGGVIGIKQPDGGYILHNSATQVTTSIGPDGQMRGNPAYASGSPVEPGDMDVNAATGTRDAWLQKQMPQRPPGYDAFMKKLAAGDVDIRSVSMRDPMRTLALKDIGTFAPDWKEQDYAAKQQAIKAAQPGGDTFKRVIGPGSAFLDHAAKAADLTDEMVKRGIISGDPMSYLGGNAASIMYRNVRSESDRTLINQWLEQKGKSTDEFNKYMHGTGGLTDQSQREGEALKAATDPATIRGRLAAMTDMMHGQLVPVAQAYHQAMKKPSAQSIDMLGPTAGAALAKLQNWTQGQQAQGAPPPTSPATATAQSQQAAAPQGGTLPPQAIAQLKPGHITTFGNLQKWTLQNGQPVRVQ